MLRAGLSGPAGPLSEAGPLLVASQTSDPFLVAMAALLQQLPWLLFGLFAGVLADRVDRKRIVVVVDLARAGVFAMLSMSVLTGTVSVGVVLGALFVIGTAEVFADSASSTLLPMLVHREDLAIGNARLQTSVLTVNHLVGPPIGAAPFAAGMARPFITQAVLVAAGTVLVACVRVPPQVPASRSKAHVGRDIAEGLRWVRDHAPVRTLVATIFIFNITFGAAWSVLVLYARHRLGLGTVGFGVLTTVSACGGLAGAAVYGRLVQRVRLAAIMRVGLVVETLTHLVLAVTRTPAVAMVIFFVFGAHAFIWGATSTTVRQRAAPTGLQGRVSGVNGLGVYGGLVIGSALGGVVAHQWGLTAPVWCAFVGSGVFLVLIWGQLANIALGDDSVPEPGQPAPSPEGGGSSWPGRG